MAEDIQIRLTVKDDGTPVVKRHAKETSLALYGIRQESEKTATAIEKVDKRAMPLTTTMEKSTRAAMALSGGLSAAGGKAAMAASAISQLVVMGLNPLGVALAGVAIAIGAWVSHQNKAEDATRSLTEALKAQFAAMRETQIQVRGLSSPGAAAVSMEATATRIGEVQALRASVEAEALREARRKESMRLVAMYGGRGSAPASAIRTNAQLLEDFATDEQKEQIQKYDEELANLGRTLADLQGKQHAAARGAELMADAQERAALTARATRFGWASDWGGMDMTWEEAQRLNEMDAAGPAPRLPADSPRGNPYDLPAGMPTEMFNAPAIQRAAALRQEIDRMTAHELGRAEADFAASAERQDRPWREAGISAGDAYVTGISSTLADAAMGRGLDLQGFATSMAETFIRALSDAFTEAAIGEPLRNGLMALFRGIGGVAGANGGTGTSAAPGQGTYSVTGGADGFTGGSGYRPVIVNEIQIAPDGLALAMSPRAARQVVNVGGSSPVRRGWRA